MIVNLNGHKIFTKAVPTHIIKAVNLFMLQIEKVIFLTTGYGNLIFYFLLYLDLNMMAQSFLYDTNIWHPLDQFEMSVLLFHWSGIMMPVGPAILTNLTIILFLNVFLFRFVFAAIFDCGVFNAWEFLLIEIYDLVKSIVRSNTP